jgi:hypothetical protein
MRTRMCIIASVLVAALSVPAVPAIAKTSPTQDAYGQVIAEVVTPSKKAPEPTQQTQAQQNAPVAAAPTQGGLPFTGLQVTLVLLAGAALLGVGVALRRATSR